MKVKKTNYITIILILTFFSVMSLSSGMLSATIKDADDLREQGEYEKAIEEYKQYEDFYNYYLIKNLNNKNMYREYSRLLADIMIRIAETYDDWGKEQKMVEYCNKIIFLSKKMGDDDIINKIRERAEDLMKEDVPPVNEIEEDEEPEKIKEEPEWIKELDNEDYLKLEVEDPYSLPEDRKFTEKELDEALDEIEDKLSEYKEEEPIVEDVVDEEPIVEDVVDEEPIVEDVVDEEPVVEDVVDEKPIVEDVVDEEPIVEDVVDEEPIVEDVVDEEPIVEDVEEELSVNQSLKPEGGPHISLINNNKITNNNFVVLHLTKFGLELSEKLGKPSFVSIDDGTNKITSDETDIKIDFLSTETARIYITINLTKEYSISELSDIHKALTDLILATPPGTSIFLTYSNLSGTINNVEINSDNLFDTINQIASKSKKSTNELLVETFKVIEHHDSIEQLPRFILSIHDESKLKARLANKANELYTPIHMYIINKNGLTKEEETNIKRLTENTTGTYKLGDVTSFIDYVYTFSLYLVQSTFVVKWHSTYTSNIDELEIVVTFNYMDKEYTIKFNMALVS